MKVSVFIAASLDGYIARENGSLDWLPGSGEGESPGDKPGEMQVVTDLNPGEDDSGFAEFFNSVDVLVLGRKSYDFVKKAGTWYYGHTRTIILSRTLTSLARGLPKEVEIRNCSARALYDELEASGANQIYVDGGNVIHQFLSEGLIDRFIITTIPVLIGGGIPLFGSLEKDVQLEFVDSRALSGGFVQNTFEVKKRPREI